MTSDKVRFRLGLFVVAGIVLGLAGILAIGAAHVFEETRPLYFYFEESVHGLSEGSDVMYRGKQIGRVRYIKLVPVDSATGRMGPMGEVGGEPVIEVLADVFPEGLPLDPTLESAPRGDDLVARVRERTRRGLRVRMKWQGISGNKYLELEAMNPAQYPPPALALVFKEPYVPTATDPTLADIQRDAATTLGRLARVDYEGISDRIVTALEALEKQVDDLRTSDLSEQTEATLKEAQDLLANEDLKRALGRFDTITADLEAASKQVRDLVARPELDQAVTDFAEAARQLRETTEAMSKKLPEVLDQASATLDVAREAVEGAKLPETAGAVRDTLADVGGAARSLGSMREDLRRALKDIASAGRQVARLARFLEEHPEALLTGKRAPTEEEE